MSTIGRPIPDLLLRASQTILNPPVIRPPPVVCWTLTKTSVNAVVFQKYLDEGIGRNLAEPTILVLDNARIHHATKACVANGIPTISDTAAFRNISLKYLPPYCPFLNPVEHAFSIIKNDFVRQLRPRTEEQLRDAILRGIQSLTAEKVNNLFEHCFLRSEMLEILSDN